MRLNKFIADCGIASRRKADELIREGLVKINEKTADIGTQVNPDNDRVSVKGKPIHKPAGRKIYLMFHKPKKVLTSMSDPEGRPVVADFFRRFKIRLFPVGRLDWDTEGLLIMTNDGDFSQRVTHPKGQIPKTYLAKLDGDPSVEKLNKLKKGVSIIGGRVKALHIKKMHKSKKDKAWIQIVIAEGKNRQVRRMFEKIGFDVVKLQRTAIGRLKLGKLPRGQYMELNEVQQQRVFQYRVSGDEKPSQRHSRHKVQKGGKKVTQKRRRRKING